MVRHAVLVSTIVCLSVGRLSAVQVRDTARVVTGDSSRLARDTLKAKQDSLPSDLSDITPGKGVSVARTDIGTLSISGYGLARYLNQLPGSQTFIDHLGREHEVDPRQDIQWHRVMVHFMGWMYMPRLRYVMTVWTVNSTEQIRIVGSLTYAFSNAFNLSAGINGIPGTRSLNGSHPFWLANDRFMADEYFRPGFTSGAWITGALARGRFNYAAMLGNNISQLGVAANELTRNLAFGTSVWWQPTTGEFGPRGGWGDYEWHQRVAMRVGTSWTRSREDRASQNSQDSPDNTQIRISDGLLLFQQDALAIGALVRQANYYMSAADLGLKYRGMFFQFELYNRWLNSFEVIGNDVPLTSMYDHGYYAAGSFYPIKQRLELYGGTSQIFGEFNPSWEAVFGINWFPADTRYFRLNTNIIRVHRSPVGSVFGFYLAGLHGWSLSISPSLFF